VPGEARIDLLEFTEHCGCGAKLGAADLRDLLSRVAQPDDPALVVGPGTFDDGAVYRVSDDCWLVQSVDFFPPVASEPRVFGRIAAANALGDIYAMGGRPLTAMALLIYPSKELTLEPAGDIIAGAIEKLSEAGASLVGGHTLEGPRLTFGLSVTGVVEPGRMLTNAGAQAGDTLVLTKPLGTGLTLTAAKGRLAAAEQVEKASGSMATLNRAAAQAALHVGAHAATDVTGFSLLGHGWQLAKASGVRIRLSATSVPLLDGVLEFASMGLVPAGAYANRRFLDGKVRFAPEVSLALQDVLFDPQTSGGLLVSLPAGAEEAFRRSMTDEPAVCCAVVGRVESGDDEPRILVEP
jgi:selenide,water dikinase